MFIRIINEFNFYKKTIQSNNYLNIQIASRQLTYMRLHHPFKNNDFFFSSIIISMNLHDQFHNLHHTSVAIKLRVSLERERMICTTSYRRNSHDFYFHANGFF